MDSAIRLVGAIAAVCSAIIAYIALRANAGVNIRNKRMDVIMNCNLRYDTLYQMRSAINSSIISKLPVHTIDEAKASSETSPVTENSPPTVAAKKDEYSVGEYFRRYWGLQSDQFDYWLDGYVDPDTISSWVLSMAENLRDTERFVGGKNYADGWDDVKSAHIGPNNTFYKVVSKIQTFMAMPHLSEEERYDGILEILHHAEAMEIKFIHQVTRNRLDRYFISDYMKTLGNYKNGRYKEAVKLNKISIFQRWPFNWG